MTADTAALASVHSTPTMISIARATPTDGPRRRWCAVARRALERMLARPVRVTQQRRARCVDVLDLYGLRFDRATGAVQGYRITRDGPRITRTPFLRPDIRVQGSPGGTLWLRELITRHSAQWARSAGAEALGRVVLRRLGDRLCAALIERWSADGTLCRLRAQVEHAFALDPELVRLARQITLRRAGPDGADEGDYDRARIDREPLLVMERDAPRLMPLYALTMQPGERHAAEPMQALRAAFVGEYGAPRHWRRFVRLPESTLAWACRAYRPYLAHPWQDLAHFLSWLDVDAEPPEPWMQVLVDLWGGGPIRFVIGSDAWLAALRAHLREWSLREPSDRPGLAAELNLVRAWIEDADPPAPGGVRRWAWWTRHGLDWAAAQRAGAAAAPALPHAEALRPAVDEGGTLALQPLRSPLDYVVEGQAMANCLRRWVDEACAGLAVAWTVVDAATRQRLASAGCRSADGWRLAIRGRLNQALPPELQERIARLVAPERDRWLAHSMSRSPRTLDPIDVRTEGS